MSQKMEFHISKIELKTGKKFHRHCMLLDSTSKISVENKNLKSKKCFVRYRTVRYLQIIFLFKLLRKRLIIVNSRSAARSVNFIFKKKINPEYSIGT